MAHVVAPVSVSYSLKDLQASSRLMDGFRLDLSPGHVLSESQIQQVVDRALEHLKPVAETTAPHDSPKEVQPQSDREVAGQGDRGAGAGVSNPPPATRSQGIRRVSTTRVSQEAAVRAAVTAALASLLPMAKAEVIPTPSDFMGGWYADLAPLSLGICIIITAMAVISWLGALTKPGAHVRVTAMAVMFAACAFMNDTMATSGLVRPTLLAILLAWGVAALNVLLVARVAYAKAMRL